MNRLLILLTIPALAGCDLSNFLNPGANSKAAYEYRASIMAPASPTMPVESPTGVTDGVSPSSAPPEPEPEITVAQEPVYVPPEPPKPTCVPVFRIVACDSDGNTILLET